MSPNRYQPAVAAGLRPSPIHQIDNRQLTNRQRFLSVDRHRYDSPWICTSSAALPALHGAVNSIATSAYPRRQCYSWPARTRAKKIPCVSTRAAAKAIWRARAVARRSRRQSTDHRITRITKAAHAPLFRLEMTSAGKDTLGNGSRGRKCKSIGFIPPVRPPACRQEGRLDCTMDAFVLHKLEGKGCHHRQASRNLMRRIVD